jgi:hypothetical protein
MPETFNNDDDEPGVESDYTLPGSDDRPAPPDDSKRDSRFDYKNGEWWYRFPVRGSAEGVWRRDPPPVIPQGHAGGEYIIVTRARELRSFTANQLHGRGGLSDLFGGDNRWPVRHYPAKDREGNPTNRPDVPRLMEAIIRHCIDHAGYYDGSVPLRSVGTWRGPDGKPLVHAGDRIFWDGVVYGPGEAIGESRYVLGADRQAPAYINAPRDGYEWRPSPLSICARVLADLEEWHWSEPEGLEIAAGWLWCAMLGDAPRWKPHIFVRAIAGTGKTHLLRYFEALLGGSAHPIQRTISRARLEERFNHSACALLLEEAEGDKGQEADRMKRIMDLLLLLSDDGAVGGRFKREIDLHGLAALVSTLTDEWRTTIKSRVTLLELKRLRDRDRDLLTEEGLAALIQHARKISSGLRARAIARWDLFVDNLVRIKARILELGGAPRDADQLGHLLAGWACMSWDEPISEDELGRLDRFKDFIVTLRDEAEGLDDANECFDTLLGLPAQMEWHGGRRQTIGQLIAQAREPEGDASRKMLLGYGLRLTKLAHESWNQAWLAIANKHPGLDRLFVDYPNYKGQRRTQILGELRRRIGSVEHEVKPSDIPLRFAGPQSRALLVPPELLPSAADDKHDADPRTPTDVPE